MELEKDLYKYLDILILESEIVKYNFARNFLYQKHIFPLENETHEFLEFCDKIVSLGSKLGYMKSISKEDDRFELTEKGISAKEKGGYFKYIDFIEKKELERIKPTIIAENYIGGNNHGIQSSRSAFTNPTIQKASKMTETIPPKKSFPEITSWVFGIVVAIIAIYEFIIKKI